VAALAGLLVLRQSLALVQWLAIAAIVAANAVSVARRPAPDPAGDPAPHPASDPAPDPAGVAAGHRGITG
jgi:hypothetical protein